MGSQARVLHHQHPVFIRAQVAYNTAGITAGVIVGHIPAGAILRAVESVVRTAFNASGTGTTNPVNVGVIPETDGLPNVAPAGQAQLAVIPGQTAGYASTPIATAAEVVPPTDRAVVISYTPQSVTTAATAGVADVVVSYYPNL